jgi:transposase
MAELRMTHIAGFERDQLLLLPEAVDDYVEVDNPVRFIEAFVDGLDLSGAGFARVEAKATGRPGDAPGDLLKLYIYGYLDRVRSSRRLEREAQRNIEVIWRLCHAASGLRYAQQPSSQANEENQLHWVSIPA